MPTAPKQFRMQPKPKESQWDSHSKENRSLYNDPRWRGTTKTIGLRKLRLREDPLCVRCKDEGRITVATHVDHIVPHLSDPEKFFNFDNTQSLCESCHNRKTAKEDGGFGNRIATRETDG